MGSGFPPTSVQIPQLPALLIAEIGTLIRGISDIVPLASPHLIESDKANKTRTEFPQTQDYHFLRPFCISDFTRLHEIPQTFVRLNRFRRVTKIRYELFHCQDLFPFSQVL